MRPAHVVVFARLPAVARAARPPLLLRRFRRAPCMASAAAAAGGAGPAAAAAPSAAPTVCRVAVAQMTSTADPEHNFSVCASLAEQAARGGARVLFLPESFAFVGARQQDALAFSQPLSGPLMARYRDLARRHRLWLSLGGFQERCPPPLLPDDDGDTAAQPPPPQQVYNAHVVVDAAGGIAAVYRKVHLFDVDCSAVGGPVLMESRTTRPGSGGLVVVPSAQRQGDEWGGVGGVGGCPLPGPLGLTTCYDVRFPEMWAALAHDRGCGVIAVPSAFTRQTGVAHWSLLVRARAVETQCYVVAAAQAGAHHGVGGRESFGDAMIVDPWGEVVARVPEGPLATGLAFADLSSKRLAQVRQRMPIAQHREAGRPRWAS